MTAVDVSGVSAGIGSDVLLGLVFLIVLTIAGIKHGLNAAAFVIVILPLVLALGFGGYLPQPLAFVGLFIAGVLVYYVIRETIGGGYR